MYIKDGDFQNRNMVGEQKLLLSTIIISFKKTVEVQNYEVYGQFAVHV